jgi:hypothetical protein
MAERWTMFPKESEPLTVDEAVTQAVESNR